MAAIRSICVRRCAKMSKFVPIAKRLHINIIQDESNDTYRCLWSKRYSTSVTENDEHEEEVIQYLEAESDFEFENEIERKRDISRITPRVGARMYHRVDISLLQPKEKDVTQDFVLRRNRRLFGKYGKASGVNPAILWPTKSELMAKIKDEKEWEPTLQEMIAKVEAEKKEKQEKIKAREKKVVDSMAKMPELLKQYEAKLHKRTAEQSKQEERRKHMMEEARDYFGYDVDPRDEKFKRMQEEKALREQQEAKKRKKAEKLAKMTARLVELSTDSPKSS